MVLIYMWWAPRWEVFGAHLILGPGGGQVAGEVQVEAGGHLCHLQEQRKRGSAH